MTRQLAAQCTECSTSVILEQKGKIDSYRRTGRTYCQDECRDAWVKRDRSARMARTNRAHASERMRRNNPMARPEPRAKMVATLARIEHKPRERRGNGAPVAEPQRKLAEHLGWPTEVTVKTGNPSPPYWYNVDIAHPTMKVAIEVDGTSHCSLARRASDLRKENLLRSLGWLVFRFSNLDAMERTAACAETVLSTTSKWTARTPT